MKKCRITIAGGGTAGWITASILAKGLNTQQFEITLVESPDIPTVGVGEATIPPIIHLAKFLDIDEAKLLKAISGTFKYGIHFENWSKIGESYMHAFGLFTKSHQGQSLSSLWLKCREALQLTPLNAFMPTAVAAYHHKFSHPFISQNQSTSTSSSPSKDLHYAYHFDAGKLAQFLKEYALSHNVKFISNTIESVNVNPRGEIASLTMSGQTTINGDYFVDCSGARSILNKQTLNGEFDHWEQYLPCNSAIVVQTQSQKPLIPYTQSIAMHAGWRWKIPLQARTGNGYVYSDKYLSDEQAKQEFLTSLENETLLTPLKTIKFKTGCLQQPWLKNSIAIGLSSGFLEPLESTSIHMTHKYALELMNAFRYGKDMAKEADDFNLKFRDDSLAIRDFLITHYCTTHRTDSAFWRYCKTMDLPSQLKALLLAYKTTGNIELPPNSLFPNDSWMQILTGQNYIADYHHLHDQQIDLKTAQAFFNAVEKDISTTINSLPSHEDYIAQYLSN